MCRTLLFPLSLGLCEPILWLTLSFYWPQESWQIDLFLLCRIGVRKKWLKFILERSLGIRQFCPFSPYKAGRDFFYLILGLTFVLGFCGGWLAGPISTQFRHMGATAAAVPNMVLLYSIPLLYYSIQFSVCQVPSQNRHGISTNNN